jgi:neutral ceramidase
MHTRRQLFTYLCLSIVSLGLATAAVAADPVLKAGAATSNITPPLGTIIVGGFAPYPADHIHDELHARCLVLDDGKTKLALVVCDLLGIHRSVSLEARRLIEKETGIPPQNVLISATHTHSAGTALGRNRYCNDQELDEYQKFVARRITDGVRRAINQLKPAEIAFTQVDVPDQVFNRRWIMREGSVPPNPFGKVEKVQTNPAVRSPNLVEAAGPTDPTVSIIAVREPGGRMIATYCAYSLHYVGGTGPKDISSDYYGMFCESMKRRLSDEDEDPPFVAMMANGTSGDINNIDRLNPRTSRGPYVKMREVAEEVAGKVEKAIRAIDSWQSNVTLDARARELELAWRPISPELLDWAKTVEAQAPRRPVGDIPVGAKFATEPAWVQRVSYAGRVQLLAEAEGPARFPVQAFRIGDIVIGTSPCETFAEIGLEFKQRSPVKKAFMVSLAHGYMGYLPTPRHFELGGYETWPGTNYMEPQTSVKLLDAVVEMATELVKQN